VTPARRYAGADGQVPLARLLNLAFAALIEDLHARLASRGWPAMRPAYGYVLVSAQSPEPCRVTDLARVLGVTKQAASQVVDAMAELDYVRREPDPSDARARVVVLTARGRRLLAVVEEVYRELEGEWAALIGVAAVERLRADLLTVIASRPSELRAHSVGSPRRGGSSTG
jgi:DNA-binding MarR family transcriptional regulator